MAGFSSEKKTDVGYKAAQGVLSTVEDYGWFSEKYGLSPNQLSEDIWLRKVPSAITPEEADANADGSFIVKHEASDVFTGGVGYVKLVRETLTEGGQTQGHQNTLWLARDNNGDNLSLTQGARLRNFINPSNHLDENGNTSRGYSITLYQSTGVGGFGGSNSTDTGVAFPPHGYKFPNTGNSANHYVTLPSPPLPPDTTGSGERGFDDFSVSMWVKFNETGKNQALVGANKPNTDNVWIYGLWDSPGKIKGYFFDGNSQHIAIHNISPAIAADEWYHLVSTFEESSSNSNHTTWKLYVNGTIAGTETIANFRWHECDIFHADPLDGSTPNANSNWFLGMEMDGTQSDGFNGEMSEVGFFSQVLSGDMVSEIYNNGDGRALTDDNPGGTYSSAVVGNLNRYYRFTDGGGGNQSTNAVADFSGNNANAVLSGHEAENWMFVTEVSGAGPDLNNPIPEGMWSFYYKEGALVWSLDAGDMDVLSNYNSNGGKYLWAVAYRYVGPTLAAVNDGSVADGSVLQYSSTGNGVMQWADGSTIGSEISLVHKQNDFNYPNAVADFTVSGTTYDLIQTNYPDNKQALFSLNESGTGIFRTVFDITENFEFNISACSFRDQPSDDISESESYLIGSSTNEWKSDCEGFYAILNNTTDNTLSSGSFTWSNKSDTQTFSDLTIETDDLVGGNIVAFRGGGGVVDLYYPNDTSWDAEGGYKTLGFTLNLDDGSGVESKTVTWKFYNKIYYGVESNAVLSGDYSNNTGAGSIFNLTTSTYALGTLTPISVEVQTSGVQYFHIAFPVRYGNNVPKFKINDGVDIPMVLAATITNSKNANGYEEDYYQYRTPNAHENAGPFTITITP